MEHLPLEKVYIFFDTATYDEIERDVKVNTVHRSRCKTMTICSKVKTSALKDTFVVLIPRKVTTEAQLGLIGGTMGLLTGFSILSGIEIIYYLLRC